MSGSPLTYHWSIDEFLRAFEAGVFDHRVELVDGDVWPVVIGTWHGRTVMRVARLLPEVGAWVNAATLPSGGSLPDPDCWVLRDGAKPVGTVGNRIDVWDPADVLLVVEISDQSMLADLQIKARLYGRAGYPVYWVVTEDVIYEHTNPTPEGYRNRAEHRRGDLIPIGYAGTELAVADLLGQ